MALQIPRFIPQRDLRLIQEFVTDTLKNLTETARRELSRMPSQAKSFLTSIISQLGNYIQKSGIPLQIRNSYDQLVELSENVQEKTDYTVETAQKVIETTTATLQRLEKYLKEQEELDTSLVVIEGEGDWQVVTEKKT